MPIHEMFPYLRVRGADRAIAFYIEVFGAVERFRLTDPENGRVGHAELELFPGATLLLSDEYPEADILGPQSVGRASMSVHLHVEDCDALLGKAEAAGAEVIRPATDQFYGERSATFRDPFGCEWHIGHEIEKVDPADMQRRWDEMVASG